MSAPDHDFSAIMLADLRPRGHPYMPYTPEGSKHRPVSSAGSARSLGVFFESWWC